MKLIGLAVVGLAYLALLVCGVNAYVEWAESRERKQRGVGCWFYAIGILRRVK